MLSIPVSTSTKSLGFMSCVAFRRFAQICLQLLASRIAAPFTRRRFRLFMARFESCRSPRPPIHSTQPIRPHLVSPRVSFQRLELIAVQRSPCLRRHRLGHRRDRTFTGRGQQPGVVPRSLHGHDPPLGQSGIDAQALESRQQRPLGRGSSVARSTAGASRSRRNKRPSPAPLPLACVSLRPVDFSLRPAAPAMRSAQPASMSRATFLRTFALAYQQAVKSSPFVTGAISKRRPKPASIAR
jgi:hypothetical protein